MEAKELRIGNWVYDSYDHVKRQWGADDFANPLQHIEPIELAEEWLEKFGFKFSGSGWCKKDGFLFNCRLTEFGLDVIVIIKGTHKGINKSCKYVHQFQNLCFALTKEEL